ncbi:MAG: hypothetical protein N4A40_12210 [Tissierellales bacterium]|jgi:hypothetical protein|nr:hypothetical protein [Tissierellales bacterium]
MNNYQEQFIEKLSRYYDVEKDVEISDLKFEATGVYNQRNIQYMASKKVEIYAFQNNEQLFLKRIGDESVEEFLITLTNWLKNNVDDIVEINEEHMETLFNFIIEGNRDLSKKEEKLISKYRYYKSYCLGFRGWINVKLFYINPKSNLIYANKRGKGETEKVLRDYLGK